MQTVLPLDLQAVWDDHLSRVRPPGSRATIAPGDYRLPRCTCG